MLHKSHQTDPQVCVHVHTRVTCGEAQVRHRVTCCYDVRVKEKSCLLFSQKIPSEFPGTGKMSLNLASLSERDVFSLSFSLLLVLRDAMHPVYQEEYLAHSRYSIRLLVLQTTYT